MVEFQWFNSRFGDVDYLKALRRQFVVASPFSFVVVKNFLSQRCAEALLLSLSRLSFVEKRSDLFHFFQTGDLSSVGDSTLRSFVSFLNSRKFHNVLRSVTGFSTSRSVDLFGSLYTSGNYLLCHDDRLKGRKVAFVYYLSHDFTRKDGGTLDFFDDRDGVPGRVVQRLVPSWNSLVLFKVSRLSWHMVSEVLSDKQRLAIGGWFH